MKRSLRARMAAAAGAFAMGLAVAGPADARVEGDRIVLGAAISLTGKYSASGVHVSNGYDLAVDTINEAGGVKVGGKSFMLEIRYYDDESTPARGARLAERLIREDGVKFMLGPYSSGLTEAIAPVTEKYGIPMVEAGGASRSLFTQGYRYLFGVLSTSEQYLASAIGLAAEIAGKNGRKPSDVKLAMAFENDPFSLDVRAGVVDDARRRGMRIVIDDRLPRDLDDMSETLARAKALGPDVLVVSGHSRGAATAVRQIEEMRIDAPMIAMTHCESARVIENFGAAANGILCPTQWAETLGYRDDLFGSAADYDRLFKAAYDGYGNVPYQAAQASAAVMVWKDAFERAGSFDTERLRQALADTDMSTFYGDIRFSEAGNNVAKPMVLRQIQDGKLNVVAPSRWASHPVEHPRKAPGG